MTNGLLGKKLGMTQMLDESRLTPVTVIEAGPCRVVMVKTKDRDGYEAVQLGFVEPKPPRTVSKAQQGHFKKVGASPVRKLAEFAVAADESFSPGDQVKVSMFQEQEYVDVVGTSRGKGTAGVMKRHGFGGLGASHGTQRKHRSPGSIGGCATPGRVFKGLRMAGRMGNARVTTQNLTVHRVDAENGLLLLKGAIPGPKGGLVLVKTAAKGGVTA